MASSSVVIKVKFGETLRRFNASITDKKLVLDIIMLQEKIRGLFSFGSDVDFTMTYVDEDGDVVTLADDEDLHDVVKQSLNPVRITVILNGSNSNAPSGNSTPLRSQNPQNPLSFQTGVSEILKSVPEPFRDALTKLPLHAAAKASSTNPAVAELMEKMKAVYVSQMAIPMTRSPTAGPSHVNSESYVSQMAIPMTRPATAGPSHVNSESSTVKVNSEAKKKEKEVQKELPSGSVDLNVPYFEHEEALVTGKGKNTADGVEKKKDDVSGGSLKPDHFSPQYTEPIDQNMSSNWAQSTWKFPLPGVQVPTDSVPQEHQHQHQHHRHPRGPHWKRHGVLSSGIGSIFHMGVRCDGCGVHPITGPRFKSKVKDNYDLCNVCFAGMGNATDYTRIERPTHGFRRHQHMPFRGFYDSSSQTIQQTVNMSHPTLLPHAMRAPGSKLPRSKLDSRFILDVNVLDGTIMAPLTGFTKIWRMRNNGTVIWPHGSQLQWIGGDKLSNSDFGDVEIPVDGLPVDKEIDVAVDFTAPELPGRYVSYWRMASPSGQKFGQRVWVLIQVDASMKDLGETTINLNLPPVTRNPEVVNPEPLMDNTLSGNNDNVSVDLPHKDHEMNFPINDSLIIDNVASAPPATAVYNATQVGAALGSVPAGPTFASRLYPTVGLDTEPVSYPIVDTTGPVVKPSGSGKVSDEREQALVKELEDMGFKQLDLNTEILRMNGYDLEKSIDDLCGVLEWDPMLEELQDMGFADNEANRRLLKKNNGSIKRVVMDLINGEEKS